MRRLIVKRPRRVSRVLQPVHLRSRRFRLALSVGLAPSYRPGQSAACPCVVTCCWMVSVSWRANTAKLARSNLFCAARRTLTAYTRSGNAVGFVLLGRLGHEPADPRHKNPVARCCFCLVPPDCHTPTSGAGSPACRERKRERRSEREGEGEGERGSEGGAEREGEGDREQEREREKERARERQRERERAREQARSQASKSES
jgi:hypothetical protein